MTRIQFLHGVPDRFAAAAEWLRMAWRDCGKVTVYFAETGQIDRFDRMLWAQPAIGFLPHCRQNSPVVGETPILLAGQDLEQPIHDRCLLNLSDQLPPGFARFQEVVEIISIEDTVRLPARERFRHYRECGYAIHTRDVSQEM